VFYSAQYLAAQRQSFLEGYPPYDFSGGEGEKVFVGRGTIENVHNDDLALRAYGLEKFVPSPNAQGEITSGERELVKKANDWLFAAA
jgi:hypothetical protein